ncbi:MAG: hypothetical protein IH847_08000, partial [Acidobacteria bacterium]|nr:hypothetical protein [Acidobacteriota bacterium]
MSTEDATYCIAHEEGLKLDKYLSREIVDRVRTLLRQAPGSGGVVSVAKAKVKTIIKTREVKVGGEILLQDPLVAEKVLAEAQKMAGKVYPMLYVFENSVREVIKRMMNKTLGNDWWNVANIPEDIRKDVEKRQRREEQEAWHGRRGAHSIHYTDIDDLIRLVQNNWGVFRQVFSRQDWFSNIVRCMETSRNTVAHMNPLDNHDIDRVKI